MVWLETCTKESGHFTRVFQHAKPYQSPEKIWLMVLTCFNHLEKYERQWEG
jgi:hypothetical protein